MKLVTSEYGTTYVELYDVFDISVFVYYDSKLDLVDISVPDCGCCGTVELVSFYRSNPPVNSMFPELIRMSLEAVDMLIHRNG